MSIENTTHQITFKADGLLVEQEIEIGNEDNVSPDLNIDDIVNGLNSGTLTTSLDYDFTERAAEITGCWIRDSSGNGVAIIAAQRVTIGGYTEFEGGDTERETESED